MPDNRSAGTLKTQLKVRSQELGVDAVGICAAAPLELDAQRLVAWLERGYGEGMPYLARNPEARFDPVSLLPGCRSVIVLAHSVYSADAASPAGLTGRIARYTRGDDYHIVIGEKLDALGRWLDARVGGHRYKATIDMSPISEKSFAVAAGIGWRGKNSLVLNRELGSFFMLGLILTTAEIEPDSLVDNRCGACTKCIDACPVGALVEPGVLDATKCISFHTTARGGDPGAAPTLAGWLFGCDICQEVCPYNKDPLVTSELRFQPRPGLDELDLTGFLELRPEQRAELLSGTALADYGLDRLVETAKILLDQGE